MISTGHADFYFEMVGVFKWQEGVPAKWNLCQSVPQPTQEQTLEDYGVQRQYNPFLNLHNAIAGKVQMVVCTANFFALHMH